MKQNATFNILDISKKRHKRGKSNKSQMASSYKLGCETRLQEFKAEFQTFFEQRIGERKASFKDHY